MGLSPHVQYFLSGFEASLTAIVNDLIGYQNTTIDILHGESNSCFKTAAEYQNAIPGGILKTQYSILSYLKNNDDKILYKAILTNINTRINLNIDTWRFTEQYLVDQINEHGWQEHAVEMGVLFDYVRWTNQYLNSFKDCIDIPDSSIASFFDGVGAVLSLQQMIGVLNQCAESVKAGLEHELTSDDGGAYAHIRNAMGGISTGVLQTGILSDQNKLSTVAAMYTREVSKPGFEQGLLHAASSVLIREKTIDEWITFVQNIDAGELDYLTEQQWLDFKNNINDTITDLVPLTDRGVAETISDVDYMKENMVVLTGSTFELMKGNMENIAAQYQVTWNHDIQAANYVRDLLNQDTRPMISRVVELIGAYAFMMFGVHNHLLDYIGTSGGGTSLSYDEFLEYMNRLFVENETE